MSSYTITEVLRTHPWEGKFGKFISYYLRLKEGEGDREYELAQKPDTVPPEVGQIIEGDIEVREHDGQNYYKLKKAQQAPGGGGGRPNGSWETPEERAARQRMIVRQSAQKVAVQYSEARGVLRAEDSDFTVASLKPIIDFFYKDAMGVRSE